MNTVLTARGRQRLREAVARAIRDRIRAGVDEAAEAKRHGVTVKTIRRWVDGDGFPSFTAAVRIAPSVGVDPDTGERRAGAA